MIILGISLNAIVPLGMELVVDAAYPVSEGTAASVLVWFCNLFSFIFLLLLSSCSGELALLLLLLFVVVVVVFILVFHVFFW